ncbi:hypothetical protein DRN86_03440 [Candidatus Geothermarchaeota archaeon]|nr:MAG: hypothetical protein DRN86_03440 [Candidatus Geothermarchaeota archaeon]
MHITLDYLLTAFLIVSLLTLSISTIYLISYNPLYYGGGPEIREIAERVTDKILFTEGAPPDWGSNYNISSENLTDFGLHMRNNSIYVLDSDKVSRLSPETNESLRIDPIAVAELLGFTEDGILNYGFSIRIYPFLNISVEEQSQYYYVITVKRYDGFPAAGARVKAIYIAVLIEESKVKNITWHAIMLETNINGVCYLNLSEYISGLEEGNYQIILVIYADYLEYRSAMISAISTNETGLAPGLQLQATRGHFTPLIAGEWDKGYFISISYDYISAVRIGKKKGQPGLELHEAELDPNAQFVVVVLTKGGSGFVVISGARPLCTPESPIIFGTSNPRGLEVAAVTRYVTINDLSFIFEFYLWPMSSS